MQPVAVVLGPTRLRRLSVVAVAAGLSVPLGASAAPRHEAGLAATRPAVGVTYGGVTSQHFPVVLRTARHARRVARATIGINLTCTSGLFITTPDGYRNLTVNKKRKFGARFGPEPIHNDDGTTADLEGSVSGTFNSRRTRASGTWSLKVTEHDAAGAVTDTCDSGEVSWRATQ